MNRLRWRNSWIELQGDGKFKNARIKGKTKRYIRKWTLKKLREIKDKDETSDI